MKIVCDACQAKYSISDDKVQGKVFKIRCKKCSNVIVVRGGAGAAEAPSAQADRESGSDKDTRVYDYGHEASAHPAAAEDAIWHLVIQQEQVGPMTAGDVQHRLGSGEIDAETFAWREGFADWTPLSQIDVFATLFSAGGAPAPQSGEAAAAVGAMFSGLDEPAAAPIGKSDDLFAPAPAAAAPADDDGSDLFAPTPAAAAASAAAHKLRGERNENSVLFSLNNLAQLASDRPMSSPSSSPPLSGGAVSSTPSAGAGSEGSGLIDIRSMASAYMGSASSAAMGRPATSSAIGSIDDLPVFGGGGFSEPAVLVPTAQRSANNKLLYLMIGAVALLAVVAVFMVVLLVRGGKEKVVVAEIPVAKPTDTKPADSKEPPKGTSFGAPEASGAKSDPRDDMKKPGGADSQAGDGPPVKSDPPGAAKSPDAPVKKPDPKRPTGSGTAAAVKTGGTGSTKPDPAAATTKPDPGPKADPGGGSCDEVSCVLNNYEGACCSKYRKGAKPSGGGAKPAGGGDLPESLDRAMISSGIAAVKARVTSCGDRSQAKGKVKVHVKVGGDGRVTNVSVDSAADPALGACVAAAVQKASFAKTANGGSFSYPFVF